MPERSTQVFTLDELWLMHRYVRHEIADTEKWNFPPANLQFNTEIVRAILFCVENKQETAALELTKGDCLVLDYCIPQDAADVNGKYIGQDILVKSFLARKEIDDPFPSAEEGQSFEEVRERMEAFNANADASNDPDAHDSGD